MSDTLVIDGKYYLMSNDILIASKTEAETTAPFAIRANTSYTLICSELASDEEITIEVYDPSIEDFTQLYDGGDAVKFALNYQKITFANESMFIRIVKPITDGEVGVSVFYA